MQAALPSSSPSFPAPLIGAGPVDGRRANAPILLVATARFIEQLDPTDASSAGESALSRPDVDRERSNDSRVPVHDFTCVLSYWRRRYPKKPVPHVAAALGMAPGTVKKWFLGQTTPGPDARSRIFVVYGEELIAGGLSATTPRPRFDFVQAGRAA